MCFIDAAFEQKSGVLKKDIESPCISADQRHYHDKSDTLMPSFLSITADDVHANSNKEYKGDWALSFNMSE